MRFRFEIMSISRLPQAGIAVLDGRLLEGSVTAGISTELIHGRQHLPIQIKGVVIGSARPGAAVLSITVDLRQEAIGLAAVGDLMVSTG